MSAVINILDAGRMAQVGCTGAGFEALLLAQGLLVLENDAKLLGMRQGLRFRVPVQGLVSLRHAVGAEAV